MDCLFKSLKSSNTLLKPGASLSWELWKAAPRVFQCVSDNLSPKLTPHKFRASTDLQPRNAIACRNCLRNGRWSAQTLVVTIQATYFNSDWSANIVSERTETKLSILPAQLKLSKQITVSVSRALDKQLTIRQDAATLNAAKSFDSGKDAH